MHADRFTYTSECFNSYQDTITIYYIWSRLLALKKMLSHSVAYWMDTDSAAFL